jgi:GT2 family glycosyltransferase
MYAEDLDLCRQIREAGFKIWWYPKTSCFTSAANPPLAKLRRKCSRLFMDAMWIYYKKWYSAKYFHLLDPFVYLATKGLYYFKALQN